MHTGWLEVGDREMRRQLALRALPLESKVSGAPSAASDPL